MVAQIPSEVGGYVAGILFYSWFCLGMSLFLLWMAIVHNERTSYVALLSFFTSLSTLASIMQQIHTIIFWNDIKRAQFAHQVADVGNPELNIAGASVGLDLVLFYIQFYTYNVMAMLVLLWAAELACSIFQLRGLNKIDRRTQLGAKGFAIFFPVLQMGLLRTSAVQSDVVGFMFLANMIMVFSLISGSILLLAIMVKYIHTRRSLMSWNVRYGQTTTGTGTYTTSQSTVTLGPTGGPAMPSRKIYDKWLVVRFSIAFVMLGAFQFVTILFEINAARTNDKANLPRGPDTTPAKARSDFILFMPGVTASLVTFVVFGTTRTFRDHMWQLFVPRRMREKYERRKLKKRMLSFVVPNANQGQRQSQSQSQSRSHHQRQPPPRNIQTNIGVSGNQHLGSDMRRVGTFYSETDSSPAYTPASVTFGDIGLQELGGRRAGQKTAKEQVREDDEHPILPPSTSLNQTRF